VNAGETRIDTTVADFSTFYFQPIRANLLLIESVRVIECNKIMSFYWITEV
jgi:hypothetical protein